MMNAQSQPTIIIGGGFTGLFTALHLSHQNYPLPVILIDQNDHFVFKPLLYELVTGEMHDDQVCPTYEELLQGSKIAFVEDKVESIDLNQRRVNLVSGENYTYNYLVLALGSTDGFFGIEGAKEHSFPFRTQEDAKVLNKHLRECLQRASQTDDVELRRSLLTVTVVGGGPSGVEMSGTLADLLPEWFIKLSGNFLNIRIVLINRGDELLKGDVNSHLREVAEKALKERSVPVELLLNASVSGVSPSQVEYKQGEETKTLATHTVIWTAGTATNPIIESLAVPEEHRAKHGLLQVTPTLQLPDFPEVFAGGDCSILKDKSLPPTAQVAYQQGKAIANNLSALVQGKQPKPAEVNLRGSLLKLGIRDSAANLFDRFQVSGEIGHLIRQGAYLELLPTPVHDFKATTTWITDEIFQRHMRPQQAEKSSSRNRSFQWVGITTATVVLVGGVLLGWRTVQPKQFQQFWNSTGLPSLFK